MFIENYMTREPQTIGPKMLLPEARLLLNEYHFRHLPVVDNLGRLLGMLTDRDLRSAYPSSVLSDSERRMIFDRVEQTAVEEIMSTKLVCLSSQSTLDDALHHFDREKVGALPVIDDEKLVGVFSIRDLLGAYKELFGVSEKGSVLITIIDEGQDGILQNIISLLEKEQVPFTRLMRVGNREEEKRIYLRVNTFKLAAIYTLLEEAGIKVIH